MKTKKILKVLVLSFLFCLPQLGEAEQIGTAFTYQGRLIDANDVADGLYDFQFKLFDSAGGVGQVGGDVDMPDIDVIDGYFTAELDFGGGLFDGSRRWLEIGVRPGELEDPNAYTTLSPRQEVTPTPYAIYAKTAGSGGGADSDWMVSGNDMYSIPSGNVGIGTTSPAEKLHVAGDIRLNAGGDIAFADDNTRIHESSDNLYLEADDDIYISPDDDIRMDVETLFVDGSADRVGIGTDNPRAKLEVIGNIIANADYGFAIGLVSDFPHVYYSPIGRYYFTDSSGVTTMGQFRDLYLDGILQVGGTGNSYINGKVGIGTTSPAEKLTVRGNLLIESSDGTDIVELGEGLDYAEGFDVSDKSKIASGSVLVIDSENPGKLTMSDKAYDNRVAGIVAGAKGMGSGVRLGSEQFDYDVALAGRVYCNVDATEAAVQLGDLLTTSATCGYAMKAADYTRAQGAILGKAMEKLGKGKKGQILVLVTLQ